MTVHLETCQEKLTTKCSDGVFDVSILSGVSVVESGI